ncbi:hypothetical protein QMY64_19195 [Phocaeicola dorei]|nr:hypothetical protein QMY64_19195 [Phocaeicola dorei]
MEVSTDFSESGKVRRLCRFGQNLPLRAKGIQPENLSLSRLYNGRRRQRKQATDGKVDTKTTPKETAYSLYYITSLYAVLIFYNRRDIF